MMTKYKLFHGCIFVELQTFVNVKYFKSQISTDISEPVAGSTLHTAHYVLHLHLILDQNQYTLY